MSDAVTYRHCPHCRAEVPVERRFPRFLLFLLTLMAVSVLVTVLLFPRFVFLFILLPFGFGRLRRAEYCGVCGRRLPPADPSR